MSVFCKKKMRHPLYIILSASSPPQWSSQILDWYALAVHNNKSPQHVLIEFVSKHVVLVLACLQVVFSPRSEAVSVISFQMWVPPYTCGEPKPQQLRFGEKKNETRREMLEERGIPNEWMWCIYRHGAQKVVWSACQRCALPRGI